MDTVGIDSFVGFYVWFSLVWIFLFVFCLFVFVFCLFALELRGKVRSQDFSLFAFFVFR